MASGGLIQLLHQMNPTYMIQFKGDAAEDTNLCDFSFMGDTVDDAGDYPLATHAVEYGMRSKREDLHVLLATEAEYKISSLATAS